MTVNIRKESIGRFRIAGEPMRGVSLIVGGIRNMIRIGL